VFAVESELQEAKAGESAGGLTEVDRRVRGPEVVDRDRDGRQLTVRRVSRSPMAIVEAWLLSAVDQAGVVAAARERRRARGTS